MPTEHELLTRIELLEKENSALRDKLDLIYSIVAPEDDLQSESLDDGDDSGGDLIHIREVN